MRVLYIDQTGQLGGGEIALLPWLCHAHADAAMLLFEDGPFRPLVEACGIPVEVIGGADLKAIRRESGLTALLGKLPAFWKLRRSIRRRAAGFDVVYANSQKAFLLAALAKRGNQPLVWHLRDIFTADHFSPLMRRAAVWAGNRYASVIIANSHATAAAYVSAGGSAEKLRVVQDGVGAEAFDRVSATAAEALRTELGVGAATLVGVFGRLSPWKGQHVLLEAVSTLPQVHVAVVGDALFGESVYAETLRARAAEPDLVGRVHFLGFRNDIPALMKSVDIAAHTSVAAEPLGLVIVEGMLAGKPVIATRAGGAAEIIEDGKSGLLTTPGSVDDLREAIASLLRDPAHARALAVTGRSRAETEFSVDKLVQRLSAILAVLCGTSDQIPELCSRAKQNADSLRE